jgi:hypothetical protein
LIEQEGQAPTDYINKGRIPETTKSSSKGERKKNQTNKKQTKKT